MSETETVDRTLAALADRRRRRVLAALRRHETLTLADLADELAEREHDASLPAISARAVTEHYMSLYHTEIPELEAAGLLAYDQERDLVTVTRRGQRVECILERALADLRPR